jgi:hypothetical protein
MRIDPVDRSVARMSLRPGVAALVAGLLLATCGIDDVGPRSRMVGGRCTVNSDCVSRCVTGTPFPGGYCTVACTTHSDCPGGSLCAADSGGVCLAACQVAADCHDFGPDYKCVSHSSQSGGTGVLVCAAN